MKPAGSGWRGRCADCKSVIYTMKKVHNMNERISIEDKRRLFELINKETSDRFDTVKIIKFSHYTSAFSALEILKSRRIWMRNSISMNDYSEIIYGRKCLMDCWKDHDIGGRLKSNLSKINAHTESNIDNFLSGSEKPREALTYIISVSEHRNTDPYESIYGRLSMWRAYGGDTSVAIILDTMPIILKNKSIDTTAMPVFYETQDQFKERFKKMVLRIENNISFLNNFNVDIISHMLCQHFHYSILSTKHPAFQEEKEWRIAFSPYIDKNDNIECTTETINGIPQLLYKLDIDKLCSESICNYDINKFIDGVMIGPNANPLLIASAFVHEIKRFYPGNPYDKIKISEIPLRR